LGIAGIDKPQRSPNHGIEGSSSSAPSVTDQGAVLVEINPVGMPGAIRPKLASDSLRTRTAAPVAT
jgi:hypothetical protein